jgi:hypothetical protein
VTNIPTNFNSPVADFAAPLPSTGHSIVSVPALTRHGSRTNLSLSLCTAICLGQAAEEKKERKVKKASDDHKSQSFFLSRNSSENRTGKSRYK